MLKNFHLGGEKREKGRGRGRRGREKGRGGEGGRRGVRLLKGRKWRGEGEREGREEGGGG